MTQAIQTTSNPIDPELLFVLEKGLTSQQSLLNPCPIVQIHIASFLSGSDRGALLQAAAKHEYQKNLKNALTEKTSNVSDEVIKKTNDKPLSPPEVLATKQKSVALLMEEHIVSKKDKILKKLNLLITEPSDLEKKSDIEKIVNNSSSSYLSTFNTHQDKDYWKLSYNEKIQILDILFTNKDEAPLKEKEAFYSALTNLTQDLPELFDAPLKAELCYRLALIDSEKSLDAIHAIAPIMSPVWRFIFCGRIYQKDLNNLNIISKLLSIFDNWEKCDFCKNLLEHPALKETAHPSFEKNRNIYKHFKHLDVSPDWTVILIASTNAGAFSKALLSLGSPKALFIISTLEPAITNDYDKCYLCENLILLESPEALAIVSTLAPTITNDLYKRLICEKLILLESPEALATLSTLAPTITNSTLAPTITNDHFKHQLCGKLILLGSPEAFATLSTLASTITDAFYKCSICEKLITLGSPEAFATLSTLASTITDAFYKCLICQKLITLGSLEALAIVSTLAPIITNDDSKCLICQKLITLGSLEALAIVSTLAPIITNDDSKYWLCEKLITLGSPQALAIASTLELTLTNQRKYSSLDVPLF